MIHYFDNCATTKVDESIMQIIINYATSEYFNPSARSSFSLQIANKLNAAKEIIAQNLGASADEILFTSGGTESDNIAILGSLRAKRGNIVVSSIEHSAVFNTVGELSNRGYEIRYANVTNDGHIDIDDFVSKVDEQTLLACFMHVSNETGAINDIKLINSLVKEKNSKTITFSDGVQAVGKIPVNLHYLGVDLYSFSGHKIHASKGTGGLYVKKGIKVSPIVFGGGQEKGIRSGTEYVGGIIALAQAVKLACDNIKQNSLNYTRYKQTIRDKLINIDNWQENCTDDVSPAIMSLAFADIKGEVLLHMLENYDIIIGTGSACSSKNKQSRLSKSIKLDGRYSEGIIRISFSKYNSLEEVELLADKLANSVIELRKIMLK